MKFFIFFITLVFSLQIGNAQRIMVSSASEINGRSWLPGDTIVMRKGNWVNQSIVLKGIGTEFRPIVLMAETPGEVILSGSSHLGFSGKYLVISGLYFKNCTSLGSEIIAFRSSTSEFAENCRLTNTAIVDCNPADKTFNNKWLSLYGANNKVDHCTFQNKANMGTLLVVWLQAGIVPNHIIDQNYFGFRISVLDINGNELNGQEIIRVGDSSTSMQIAGVSVTNNFFDRCCGEIEVISNKSCGNYYSNNLFYECKGLLTLRHGNSCTVEGNYFFGNGVSNTGGIRIIGENHKVYNNYFEKLRGTNFRSGICMVRGLENSALNEYFQVKNAFVAFNTMVDCSQAFSINYNSGSTYAMPPIGCVIAHNQVYNSSTSNTNVNIDLTNVAAMNVVWKNNLMNQGKYTNFTYTSSQVITSIDPKMVLAGTNTNMYEPSSTTGLLSYATSEYSEVNQDIRGRSRNNLKLPGASQASGTTSRQMPSLNSVGAVFLRLPTEIFTPSKTVFFKAYTAENQIITETLESGELVLFDIMGKTLLRKNISEGINRISISQTGTYLVNFTNNASKHAFCKLFINKL